MNDAAALIAIDAGQSATRSVAVDLDGQIIRRGIAPGVRRLSAPGAFRSTGASLVTAYRAARHDGPPPERVAIGLSGWPSDRGLIAGLLASTHRRAPSRRLMITSDAITAFIGASGRRAGVVVAAGTGTVVVAADASGGWAQIDGLGHVLGDRGSGFWIGREALAGAIDGDRNDTEFSGLRTQAQARFGPLDALVDALERTSDQVVSVAGFASDVAVLAKTGDPAAVRIWREAGRALGRSALAAASRVFARGAPVRVTLTGGLAASASLLLPAMTSVIQMARPDSSVRPVRNGPIRGAVLLARHPTYAGWFPGAVAEHGAR